MKPILELKGIGKQYKIGGDAKPYLSLRDSVVDLFKGNRDKDQGKFWALNDVSFDVYPGDTIGIIGRNGAGKSTLLKILSKITPPTIGHIKARGRVASLLEVGTGFHPELTGSENVYLNGSILGLTRTEIRKKFDEIVDFSGVEKFLETPLKHYSSGMQLRLAFAVAAHLEPEILVVDEVLAVGDAAFQKKCLGKMDEVSKSGRTILFVSHNMGAVRQLCKKGVLLNQGNVELISDDINDVLIEYLNQTEVVGQHLSERSDFESIDGVKLNKINITDDKNNHLQNVYAGQSIKIKLDYSGLKDSHSNLLFKLEVFNSVGTRILILNNRLTEGAFHNLPKEGVVECRIAKLPLNEGLYRLSTSIISGKKFIYKMDNIAEMVVIKGDFYSSSLLPEKEISFLVEHDWVHEN